MKHYIEISFLLFLAVVNIVSAKGNWHCQTPRNRSVAILNVVAALVCVAVALLLTLEDATP